MMQNNVSKRISLNCIDKTILAFNTINEPFLIHSIIDIEGDVDHIKLGDAIHKAQDSYPIMRSVVRNKHFRPYREIQDDICYEVLTLQDLTELDDADYDSVLFEWFNLPLDVTKAYPVRAMLLNRGDSKISLVFTFHHSATDALRACIFIRRVIDVYNDDIPEKSESIEDIRRYRKVDELVEFAGIQRSKVRSYYRKMIFSIIYRLVIAAVPFPARVFKDRSGKSRASHLCNVVLPPDVLQKVEDKAYQAGVELNDICLAAASRTVEKWNAMHGRTSNLIRIMAPVNISPKGFRHVLSNQISWLSPTSNPEDRVDPVMLLKKMRSSVLSDSRRRIPFSLIYFFYIVTRVPIVVTAMILKIFVLTQTYVDSILFTNIGVVWPKVGSGKSSVTNLGSARIVNFTGAAPVMTPWRLAFGASIYNRIFNISLAYRPAMYSREKAQKLLDLFVHEVVNYETVQKHPQVL